MDPMKSEEESCKNVTLIRPDPRLIKFFDQDKETDEEYKPPKRKQLNTIGYKEKMTPVILKKQNPHSIFSFNEKLSIVMQLNLSPDIIVLIGAVQFNCHMIVLQCYSEIFQEYKNGKIFVLPEQEVDAVTFSLVYKWMVGNHPLLGQRSIVRMFKGANFLKMPSLLDHLWCCLNDNAVMCEEKAFSFYLEAQLFDLPMIADSLLLKINYFFLSLVATKDFVEMKFEEVVKLFKSHKIGVNNEAEVFMSAVRWINYDWQNRQKHVYALMETIRFGLMSPQFVTFLKSSAKEPEVSRIVAYREVSRFLDEGLRYSIMILYYAGHPTLFKEWLQEEKMETLQHRNWIYDRGCPYHHRSWCKFPVKISYQGFISYLEEIKKIGISHRYMLEPASDGHYASLDFCCKSQNE